MSLPSGAATLAATYTDFQGLNKLKAAAREQTPAAKVEAAKQFEALFIQMMLKSMREATPHDSLFGSSQERLYQGLYDHQLALNMAQGQGMGLRTMIEKALGATTGTTAASGTSTAVVVAGKVTAANASTPTAAQSQAGGDWPPASPQAFVEAVLPYAKAAAEKIGVAPEVLIAQAALETGWGKHVPVGPNGASSNNLLGIKTGGGWSGDAVKVSTLEYRDGVAQKARASFRAYPSIAACFSDYAQVVTQQPRYHEAVAQGASAAGYLDGLQRGGYATDPAYASKVNAILNSGVFRIAFTLLAYAGSVA